jgi:peptidyl-tRNA hydrolase, PTH1 family
MTNLTLCEGEDMPYLVVGLGNPGRKYRANRHNVGFMIVDKLAEDLGIRMSRVQMKAIIGSGKFDNNKIFLAKPQTYMNLSGVSVASLVKFYQLHFTQILVIHDDLDLPLGTLRLRPGGGAGGQKGLASIIERLGTQEFPRLRIGIDHPPGQMDAAAYVLRDFSTEENDILAFTIDKAVGAIKISVTEGLQPAMNKFNGHLERD